MERRRAAPAWRASLGLIITVIAAGLLALASWQAFGFSREAGEDTATLARERLAVEYQQKLYALLIDANRFRLQMQVRSNPPFSTPRLRAQIDARMHDVTQFSLGRGESLEALGDWQNIERTWSKIRSSARISENPDLETFPRSIGELIYRVEDTSGLEYETNRYSQDLGDMLFSKMPGAVHEALYLDLLGENAQTQGFLSIPNRVHVARLLSLSGRRRRSFDRRLGRFSTKRSGRPLWYGRRRGALSRTRYGVRGRRIQSFGIHERQRAHS